jgi:hypothetical protein
MKLRLYDCAKVLRSKNSGPFQITLDCLFDDPILYEKIKRSGLITKQSISDLYKIPEEMVCDIVFYDPALGFKATFCREVSSGTCGDTDVYGAQQHAPLMELLVDID